MNPAPVAVRPFKRAEIRETYGEYNKNLERYPFLDPSPIPIEALLGAFDSGDLLTDQSGHLAIEFNLKVIGFASFRPLEKHIQGCNVGLAICNPSAWGHGFGSRALVSLSRFLFESGRAARLEWKSVSEHVSAIRAAEKAGYFHEGISRSAALIRGKLRNVTRMSLLVSDKIEPKS